MLATLAVAYDIPWWVALPAAVAVIAAGLAAETVAAEPGRRPRLPRRSAVWPDGGMKVIADALVYPCIIADAAGIVRYVNREATSRFGLVQPGDPLSFRLRVTALHDALDRVVALDQPETVQWTEKIPTERWLVAHLGPIHYPPDPHGSDRKPDFILIVVEDLTEQRRSERMRVDFVANASHELRTPLAALSGFIETLQGPARNDTAARERFLTIMAAQAGRMRRLIDDLLSLSRIEMKAHVRPDTIVDLAEILSHTVESLKPLADDSGVAIETEWPADGMAVRGDRDELLQVFANLVENAIKYGADGKVVEVAARAEPRPGGDAAGEVWAVSITDRGPGIAREHLPRLTERFYRADIVSSREKQGTGLGLAIVKHILARHRGRLTIDSEPGRGATFTVRLDGMAAERNS